MAQAPGTVNPMNSAIAQMQQNLQLRQMLLGSAPAMIKNLGNFGGGTPGSTTRVKLFNVGITTKLFLDVRIAYTVGTAAVTMSPKAPFNAINKIKLTDFDGTDRVNCSGYQAWVWNCVRKRKVVGYNNGSQTAVVTQPNTPLGVAANTMQFQLEIPLAYDAENDLRGALLTQTAVGEAWLSIDWNNLFYANGNDDAVFNGAATSTVTLITAQVDVWQSYLLPQSVSGNVPLPVLDLMTVYEFNGALRSADNIAAGQEKLINYPNVRSVIGFYANFLENSILQPATTNITRFRLITNGNNVFREYNPVHKLIEQRNYMSDSADLRAGTYFETHRDKPIETALYGNVQYGITPSQASGTSNFEVGFESFYTKGSMLPGLTQGS